MFCCGDHRSLVWGGVFVNVKKEYKKIVHAKYLRNIFVVWSIVFKKKLLNSSTNLLFINNFITLLTKDRDSIQNGRLSSFDF